MQFVGLPVLFPSQLYATCRFRPTHPPADCLVIYYFLIALSRQRQQLFQVLVSFHRVNQCNWDVL